MMTLNNLLNTQQQTKFATDNGTKIHKQLQHVVIDNDTEQGDIKLVSRIKATPSLIRFFNKSARTEVPIAGKIKNIFISRRIDRLCIDNTTKTIEIIDYKTDIIHDKFYTTYISQIREYVTLLRAIYPEYKINAYILWIHDFSLEKIV